jgi:hypothetical protein
MFNVTSKTNPALETPMGATAAPPAFLNFSDIVEDTGLNHGQVLALLIHLGTEWEDRGNSYRVRDDHYRAVRPALLKVAARVVKQQDRPGKPGRRRNPASASA